MKNLLVCLALLLAAQVAQATPAVYISRDQSPVVVIDVQAATYTSTTVSAGVQTGQGSAYSVQVPVGTVSGTNPTLDVEVQESDDQGSNWFAVYDFPRITATGVYRSTTLPVSGNKIRYVLTVGGTSPSFAATVKRQQENWAGQRLIRQMYDRTINLTTGSSTTAALYSESTMNAELAINVGTVGTAPAVQLQCSDDGTTWFNVGSALTAVASSTVGAFNSNIACKWLRAQVSSAGATVVPGYVLVKGY